jgi:Kef-type K+ transport system membrane component KefB/predicted amino acid-binding ACT domain protein
MVSVDLARLLLDLLIVLAAAKLAAEGAERFGVPAVLGEILAGIVIGPSVLGLVELTGARGVSLGVLAELGVLLLLVQVGMEMDLAELGRVGRASLVVALVGVAVPFIGGAAAGVGLGLDGETAIFIGAALTATSVGITARVLGDLRALATVEARIVLGAAVADDVLGLILLTVVVKVVGGDEVTLGVIGSTVGIALGFLLLAGAVGLLAVPRLLTATVGASRSGTTVTVLAFVIILGFAVLADAAQLAFIIGAFMAGLAIGRSEHGERVAGDLNSIGRLLIPVFFVLIGVNADLAAMLRPSVLLDASVLFVIAVVGKVVSSYGAAGTRSDRLLVGLGMIPRGEVGLIFASIGLAQGVLDDELYGALLLVILMTTVITPPLLRWRIDRVGRADTSRLDDDTSPPPTRGWVSEHGGTLALAGRPPSADIVTVALQAAALAEHAVPSDDLLTWFGDRRDVKIDWTSQDTEALLALLSRAGPRAVRLLEVSGVLERAVPTIADALTRRRADPAELDPTRHLRFPTVEALAHRTTVGSESSSTPLAPAQTSTLAALVIDVLGLKPEPRAVDRLLAELAVEHGAPVQRTIESARLLRAAAADVDGYDESEINHLAAHIANTGALDAAAELAAATTHDDDRQRRLNELVSMIEQVLSHPELQGPEAVSLADSRRRDAMGLLDEESPRRRLERAPDDYVLGHTPEELARQARLVEPLAARGSVRVSVSPEGTPDHWLIDVAGRDADGMLAALATALTDAGCDIAAATVATWPDGAVVDTFLVRSAVRPSARRLAEQIESALHRPPELRVVRDLHVRFDNDAAPWHTLCTVAGCDRPGTLAALAAAFAATGVRVHSARLTVTAGQFSDRFALTDRLSRKLDGPTTERVTRTLAGSPPRTRLLRHRRRARTQQSRNMPVPPQKR